jgi:hypothetical protein
VSVIFVPFEQIEYCQRISVKLSSTIRVYDENPSSVSRVVSRAHTNRQYEADVYMLFEILVDVSKNRNIASVTKYTSTDALTAVNSLLILLSRTRVRQLQDVCFCFTEFYISRRLK